MLMSTFMKADIFFFITTLAVIVFTALAVVISVYIVRILKKIDRAADRVEAGIESFEDSFLFNLLFGKRAKHKKAKIKE